LYGKLTIQIITTMKITITGSLGHISKPLTEELVRKGHTVTVISSKAEKQQAIEALGAFAAIGSIEDANFLASAFTAADVVYTMLPPLSFFVQGYDMIGRAMRVGNAYAQAIQQSGVKRVVHLSSIGAHLEKGSGLIRWAYEIEGILNTLSDVAITFMRPVGFYYNLLAFIPGIKSTGMIASNYGGDDVKPWVSPIDIASTIAEELQTSPVYRKVLYVASEEISCNEIATILGEAIGKPDLRWIIIPGEQLQLGMEKAGVPTAIAAGLVEMNEAIHSGLLYEDYYRNRPTLGTVKLREWAKEFAVAYNS
jgi:uncharacterized protein YbjT (DUF2867 family)